MDISYERIVEVNKGITYTDVRGKNYAEVAQRVQAFRNLIPGGYITTEILKIENGVVYMKAEAGYYKDGIRVMLATGLAFERQDASNINKTSYIENCETSAIGRALGFIGLGSEKSIASAEEVKNAIDTQEAIERGDIPDPAKVDVTKGNKVPDIKQPDGNNPPQEPPKQVVPVLEYLAKEREELRKVRSITKAENAALWNKQVEVMKGAGIIPNKPLSTLTMDEAQTLVEKMYTRFKPTGTELLPDDGKVA